MDAFRRKAVRNRVPVSGMLELTRRCNLRCVHCYQQGERNVHLPTETALRLVREAADCGTLFLTLTGGEPLLHPDFPHIYRACREAGLVVGVFTNGTLIAQKHIELFQRWPPRLVELSIYGAGAETHDRITGVPGSFAQTLAAVRRLREAGVSVGLKTVILQVNLGEVRGMQRLASELGVPFRVDPLLFGNHAGGGQRALALRAAPEAAVRCELDDHSRAAQWRDYARRWSAWSDDRRLFRCGAAITGFFIGADAVLAPCALALNHSVPLNGVHFREAWERLREVPAMEAPADYPCARCELRAWCSSCPALAWMEKGNELVPVEYACEIARWRARLLGGESRAEARPDLHAVPMPG